MRFRILKNMIKQGFEGTWRNKGMGFASISSITAVLIILGIVLILILGINNLMDDMKSKFDILQIYLDDDISPKDMAKIEEKIREDERITSFEFESDQEALKNLRGRLGDDGWILDGLESDNPLPNSYIIKVGDMGDLDDIVGEINSMDGIEDVPYHKDDVEKLMDIAKYLRYGGIAITAILVFVSIFIISNTIKLAVSARKTEINIMKYVGATNSYIRGPFIIEGMIYGLIASLVSSLIINIGYDYFFKKVNDQLYRMLSVYLIPPSSVSIDIGIIFMAIGVGIGALGSIISMRKHLDV